MTNKLSGKNVRKRAVVDLGTNTFHLLAVEWDEHDHMKVLFRERIFVKLAEDGIQHIGQAPFQRAIAAMRVFKDKLDQLNINSFKAFGTAALRTAVNGKDLVKAITAETGIEVALIDGMEEARLIHLGVSQAVPFDDTRQLIMDIGGGSVEFIIANKSEVFWSGSFMVGVGILFEKFHKSDPISTEEIEALRDYLDHTLVPLKVWLNKEDIPILTGASGAFETILDLMEHKKVTDAFSILEVEKFPALYQKIINSTLRDRRFMPSIPEERVEMIVVSTILVQWILDHSNIQRINVSGYALKEGMLAD
jgi:exopolyphosphatase/guanosine-5'-triphosphate,3'-diphosphate pyrophosphatase